MILLTVHSYVIYFCCIPRSIWVWQWIRIVDAFIIPSTCICGRDIVVTLLVRVCVCVSVCLHLIAS